MTRSHKHHYACMREITPSTFLIKRKNVRTTGPFSRSEEMTWRCEIIGMFQENSSLIKENDVWALMCYTAYHINYKHAGYHKTGEERGRSRHC